MEKYSEEYIRIEKINKIKERILKDIEKEENTLKKYINAAIYHKNNNIQSKEEEWFSMIIEEYALLCLKEYILKPDTFLEFYKMSEEEDYIIYVIPDKYLNIWLQENYPFVSNFIGVITEEKDSHKSLHHILNDTYFSNQFMSAVEIIYYQTKMKEDHELEEKDI